MLKLDKRATVTATIDYQTFNQMFWEYILEHKSNINTIKFELQEYFRENAALLPISPKFTLTLHEHYIIKIITIVLEKKHNVVVQSCNYVSEIRGFRIEGREGLTAESITKADKILNMNMKKFLEDHVSTVDGVGVYNGIKGYSEPKQLLKDFLNNVKVKDIRNFGKVKSGMFRDLLNQLGLTEDFPFFN